MTILQFKNKGLFRVHWQVKATGVKSCGQPISEGCANASANSANVNHPEILHWVEPTN